MNLLTKFSLILCGVALAGSARGQGSTITFGKSAGLVKKAGKKRNFKADIAAVTASHESWKKAHLNETLYACQRNAERVATLARKVSDRIELAKKDAVASSRAVEKAVNAAVGADATEVPAELGADQVAVLKAKAAQLAKAKKQADLLERLSAQVEHFYEYDMPKESAVDGNCVGEYRAAMQKGVAASVQYHQDSEQLSAKLDKLAQEAEIAWRNAATALVAGR
jgi:hypothetical protein